MIGGKIALVGAGTVALIDKFMRMFMSFDLSEVARELNKERLSLSEVLSKVAEPMVSALYNEYVRDRQVVREDSFFDLIVAGFEEDNEVSAFTLYGAGLAEPINDFGAIGSGAAYAELFLRHLLPPQSQRNISEAIRPVCYTIRLVETIDPFVGGRINLISITSQGIEDISDRVVELPGAEAEKALKAAMERLKELLNRRGGGECDHEVSEKCSSN